MFPCNGQFTHQAQEKEGEKRRTSWWTRVLYILALARWEGRYVTATGWTTSNKPKTRISSQEPDEQGTEGVGVLGP